MRKKNRRLVLYTVLASVLVLTACQATQIADHLPPILHRTADVQAEVAKAFGPVDQKVAAGDGLVVISPAMDGARELAYVAPVEGGSWRVVGQRQQLPDAASARLHAEAGIVAVETRKETAPQFAAFKYGGAGIEPTDWYAANAPEPTVKTGSFVLVNKHLNALWYYENGKLVKAFRVATGRDVGGPAPTWQDYRTNYFTPEGTFQISDFKTNPPYTGFKPGDERHSFAGGAPDNPLGTRWMGFSVLKDDGANIWGIHGTSEPEKIGTWASDGCIRMYTQHVEQLFALIKGKNPTLQVVAK